jgi:hypothetical protein
MLRLALLAFLSLSLTGCASSHARAAPVPPADGRPTIVVSLPPPPPLPFRLAVRAAPPETLAELEAAIYEALPEEHLRFVSRFLGAGDQSALRGPDRTQADLVAALYAGQIVTEAFRQWGFDWDRNPFRSAIECIEPRNFAFSLIRHIGFEYIETHPDAGEGDRDVLAAHQSAYNLSRRLFELCERRRR